MGNVGIRSTRGHPSIILEKLLNHGRLPPVETMTAHASDFVSGGSKDFAYDIGVPWTCTLELRDTGEYGFLLPEEQVRDFNIANMDTCDIVNYSNHLLQIEPVCVETTAALRSLSDAAIELWLNRD